MELSLLGVHLPEMIVGARVSLIGGFLKPQACLPPVFRHALSVVIQQTEDILSLSESLTGGFSEPLRGQPVVLRHAASLIIINPDKSFGDAITLVGKRAKYPKRRRVIATIISGRCFF